ncbi:cytochrome ubiquinol oxidase subunit I [Anaeromyxobacter paludicola]|uniref:Cytochrome ubiquinol oxidase subunit I n=1 Tax=Anaeromyxobacter paludicola TaxID=2918171 RepID=A0ABM7XEL4_9BACT|nr:cytochrome ubiquinol oxidase subunit I [Anaeromyxobacter paludicola]BDG10335.1 cytochrome ubiquinol oxidase subunit I [Anaeromyxobacter paludicola]
MDALMLARIQFAVTIGFHFIFPPISIGLGWMLVAAEWLGWKKNDPDFVRVGKFFGKLFAVNFAVGVATGIVMEFQFGTNWAQYSKYVGDIFGAPLAAEGVFAFFLESTFLGLYLYGRGRVSKALHWFSALMVAVGATLSAFWIIVANSWQQTPAGYVVRNGRAELTSFYDAVFNPSTMPRYLHTVTAAIVTGAFVMAGVAAWHLLRDRDSAFARKAMRIGVVAGLIFSILEVMPFGHLHAQQVARTQPEKFAAIEGLYTSQNHAPLVLFAIPFSPPPQLKANIEVPGMLSWMAFGDMAAHVQGLDAVPQEDRPPLWLTFVSFHNMVALGSWFILVMSLAAWNLYTGKLFTNRLLLKALVWSIPLPVVACELGWTAAEVGRQPWIVYKLLRTSQAHSATVTAGEIWFSLLLFGAIYLALGALWLFLMIKKAKTDPDDIQVGAAAA